MRKTERWVWILEYPPELIFDMRNVSTDALFLRKYFNFTLWA